MTAREIDVLRLIAAGRSNAEIGAELFVSSETVKTHVSRILAKLDARDRTQAVIAAYESGIVRVDACHRTSDVRGSAIPARNGERSARRQTGLVQANA